MDIKLLSTFKVRRWAAKFLQNSIYTYLLMQSVLMRPVESLNCSQPTPESLLKALRETAFTKTAVRPVITLKTPTKITLGFTMYAIIDLDEKAQTLDTFLWLWFDWQVEGLSWDPVECGTDRITLPRKKLWRPDLVINEFMNENQTPETYYLTLYNTGKAEDGLPFHVISSCNLDIYSFPFDIQNCTYTFSSYKHTKRDVQLFFSEPAEDTLKSSLFYMETKGEWELIDLVAGKPQNSTYFNFDGLDSWDELAYYIVMRRRPTLYVVNLLIPSYFLITVDLFSFLLPPQNVDRSAFKMTLILGYTVFLLLMNDLLPVTGNTIPIINVFFSLCLALMVASLLETILVTNILCGSSNYPPLPNWVKVLFLHYIARLICLGKRTSEENSSTQMGNTDTTSSSSENKRNKIRQQEKDSETSLNLAGEELKELGIIHENLLTIRHHVDKHFSSNQNTKEWIHLGEIIDRFLFISYIIFLSVSFITIIIFWMYWYSFGRKTED
ncbi:5-hydroxytryptamine receptor 3C-like [Triplophysa dalaica]|uniref:5-hydroxytryptamine receptor 3C-like n=1 Tax=Triplophysa dalaica TaxID=1582913 RepID=UPI0024DFAC3A|nr:5-hydroxytryptamine receptor 3C-like [Triplophysa dalaica]